MSHIEEISIEVRDVDALREACNELGCDLIQQPHYKWFGEIIGDGGPLPAGFTAADMGQCSYAIKVRGANAETYEVGVVQRRDGKPGFVLMWDSWQGGYGLQAVVGEKCGKLVQSYATQVAIKQARRQGFAVQQKRLANGKIQLTMSKG